MLQRKTKQLKVTLFAVNFLGNIQQTSKRSRFHINIFYRRG